MPTYYNGNDLDTTTKEQFTNTLINKIVEQKIDEKIFENPFAKFYEGGLDAGFQIEEIEVGNLTSEDFDPTGANPLTKKNMSLKAIYHKINRDKTMKATISNKQLKTAMLSPANTARVAQAIITEMYNSTAIEDFEAVKNLFKDIAVDKKNMVICDLNENGGNMDALAKTVQTLATNMTFPNTAYNYLGYKKEFSKKDELILIIDSATRAKLNVDSLASAFNMDKKDLVANIIVLDELPEISYTAVKADAGKTIEIGENTPIKTYKYNASGASTVTGKAIGFLISRRALVIRNVDREMTEETNAKGRFINKYLHSTDILSYSPLKNAIVLVD